MWCLASHVSIAHREALTHESTHQWTHQLTHCGARHAGIPLPWHAYKSAAFLMESWGDTGRCSLQQPWPNSSCAAWLASPPTSIYPLLAGVSLLPRPLPSCSIVPYFTFTCFSCLRVVRAHGTRRCNVAHTQVWECAQEGDWGWCGVSRKAAFGAWGQVDTLDGVVLQPLVLLVALSCLLCFLLRCHVLHVALLCFACCSFVFCMLHCSFVSCMWVECGR